MRTITVPPLYGPPMPRISFFHGSRYLGVTSGLPSAIETARAKLMSTIIADAEAHLVDREIAQLSRATAQMTCGMVVLDLT